MWKTLLSFSSTVLLLLLALVGGNVVAVAEAGGFPGFGRSNDKCRPPCVPGDESIMRQKEHGTSHVPVQTKLRWQCDSAIADRICNYNRHYAEMSGYWEGSTTFLAEESTTSDSDDAPITFYDSNTGAPLITAPVGRTFREFAEESRRHGWPSFRDAEVNWDNVRVLPNGETVSTSGTHLGHNLPDASGNRYCLNLVSLAGNPTDQAE
jgi:hypothetical protein